jgi:Amino acid permease
LRKIVVEFNVECIVRIFSRQWVGNLISCVQCNHLSTMVVLTRVAAVTSAGMTRTSPERTITFTDAVAIIVGNVIGSGIFISPRGVFVNAGSTGMALILWTMGGLLSAIGAVCYVRLGQLIPRSGGDYIYINKLWGRLPGFVTFWMTVAVANPLSQGISAITFASYLVQPLFDGCQPPQHAVRMIAASAISRVQIPLSIIALTNQDFLLFHGTSRFLDRRQLSECPLGHEDPERVHGGQSFRSRAHHFSGPLAAH